MATWNSSAATSYDKGGNKTEWGVLRCLSASAVTGTNVPETSSPSRDGACPQKTHSMSNVNVICRSCRELKIFNFPLSMVRDCDPPKEYHLVEPQYNDFCIQVTAVDIQSGRSVQTSQTLLEYVNSQQADLNTDLQNTAPPILDSILPPTRELSARPPNILRILTASKCLDCRDCEENRLVPTGQYKDDVTQTESWWITWHELSQTGPSLVAVGSFCRFDYKLRKSKSEKTNVFCDCFRPVRPGPLVVCSQNRDECSDFQQQVSSLNISITEMEQTEQGGDIEKAYLGIVYSSYRPQDADTMGKAAISPLDFESPYTWERKYSAEPSRCFEMQVSQNDICATKLVQTDRCLLEPYACRKSRKFYKLWNKESTIPRESLAHNLTASSTEAEQQVAATDIGDTDETQTCPTLSTMRPFHAATSCQGSHILRENTLEKFSRDMQIDMFGPCCPATETATFADASNQTELGTSTAVQTYDQTPNLNKCYIRRQKHACKSWC